MLQLLRPADNLLRGKTAFESTAAAWILLILGGMLYGGVMGSYGFEKEVRPKQMAFSAIKTPLLLLATFVISLPSFFVLNTLFGVRHDFGRVLKALATSQASSTLVLASLAPYTAFWYASFKDYTDAILFNGLVFGVASLAGQAVLRKAYRPLISSNARHHLLLWIWLAIYSFVGIQMGWSLRPFIGSPGTAVEFLRESDGDNVYVVLFNLLRPPSVQRRY
jgi:hypothetical protein